MKPLAVLFALPFEARPLLRAMTDCRNDEAGRGTYSGVLEGIPLLVGISGTGASRAESKARDLLSHGASALIVAGFAGALNDELVPGDVIATECAVSAESPTAALMCDERLLHLAIEMKAISGHIVTTPGVVSKPDQKLALGRRHSCCAVDMESAPAAAVAAEMGIPFVVVRAIVDRRTDTVPHILSETLKPNGDVSICPALRMVLTRPGQIPHAVRLATQSGIASRSLTSFLTAFLPRVAGGDLESEIC
jgi:adenosylhomocysteine nucleosidase